MEQEEMIASFKAMIEELQNNYKELKDAFDNISKEAAAGKRNYDKSQFVERNKDFFDKYRDDVDFIEKNADPDFSFDDVVFDGKGDMDEAEYIAALGQKLSEQLEAYGKHFGGKVEAETKDTDADGEPDTTEIEVKDEEPEEKAEDSAAEEEAPVEEESKDEKLEEKAEEAAEPEKKDPFEEEKAKFKEKFNSIYR